MSASVSSQQLDGHGLRLMVHRFAARTTATATTPRALVLLLHGFLDAGSSWDLVATPLARAGFDVVAPDLRGFGDSDRVSGGGYYHFPNYLADVDALLRQLQPERLVLVGHSMGGTVASLYAGSRPEAVDRLVLLEGLGPPVMSPALALPRTRRWLDALAKPHEARPLVDEADALARLRVHHSRVPDSVLRSRVPLLTRARADGQLEWRFDPLHRSMSPLPFNIDGYKAFLGAIGCPTLFIGGGPSGWHPPDEEQRLAAIGAPLTRVALPEAGHMMHWTQPAEVAAAIAHHAEA